MSDLRRRNGVPGAIFLLLQALLLSAPLVGLSQDPTQPPAREPVLRENPPATPGGLRVEASGESAVWVKWNPSDDDEFVLAYEVHRGDGVVARTRSLSYTDTGLAAANRYCYSVRAVDESGRPSRSTAQACVTTPDLTPPETPVAPAVTLDSPTSVAASWSAVQDNVGVAGYELLRGGRLQATITGLRAGDSGLRAAKTYCYAVRAFDRAGNRSSPSPEVCVTPPDVTPPTPPRAVAAGLPRAMTVDWPPSSDDVGVAGYEVLLGAEVVATTRELATLRSELPPGRHCVSVRAFDAAGNRSEPVEACAVVPDTTPPTPPAGVEVVALGETATSLRWTGSTDDVGVVGYEVVRDEQVVARATGLSAGEESLRPYTAYCYRVRALDAAGNRSDPSAPGCVMTPDLTPPLAPSLVSASPLSDRALRVTWLAATDNVGIAGYEILRDGAVVGRSAEPSFELKRLLPGRDYCVEVRAFDPAGLRSPISEKGCGHTPDLTPPTVPGGVLAAATTSTRVAVAWSPSEDDVGVAGYEVWRGDVLVARVEGTRAMDGDLAPASEHCYELRAFDAAGNRSDRSKRACARTAPLGSPGAPVDLEAVATGARTVALRWKPSPDPGVVYAVFWDGEKRIGSTRFETYKVEGLKPGQRRCFQVAALDGAGNSSAKTWPVCASTPGSQAASTR
jgi:hypothetical protein